MKSPSGRFVLRLDPLLHKRAKKHAQDMGVSLNELCVRAVQAIVSDSSSELRADLTRESSLLIRLKELYKSSLIGVLLFGSVARGEQRVDSDIDLLIVMKSMVKLTRKLYAQWDHEDFDPRLSPHFVHLPDSVNDAGSIWLEAAIDGTVLFEADRSLSVFLRNLRYKELSGQLERKTAYGHPYWVRKDEEPLNVQ